MLIKTSFGWAIFCRLRTKLLDKTITAMPVNLLSGIMVKLQRLTLPVLDKLAVSYDEELAKSPRKSFITNDTPSNTELELKFNIVKEIITDKLKEKADRETAKNKAAEKARLTELLAKKQSEKLESLSEDEIKRRLAELG